VVNPKIDLGCAQWCSFADQCVGLDGIASKTIINTLIKEIEEAWNSTRVNHVRQVLKFTGQIQIVEGGDPLIIKAAALLHDCGYPQGRCRLLAEEGDRQQPDQAQPNQAQQILEKHKLHPETIARILGLIDWRRSARDTSSIEYRILWDAECLAMIPEEVLRADKVRQDAFIAATLLTQTGRQLAAYRLKSAA
jgi:HD superfamily phosphodiesterase